MVFIFKGFPLLPGLRHLVFGIAVKNEKDPFELIKSGGRRTRQDKKECRTGGIVLTRGQEYRLLLRSG